MKQREFIKLLERYNTGTCTPDEKNLVENWFDSLGDEKGTIKNYREEDRDKMFEFINASKDKVYRISPCRPRITQPSIAVAAAIVLAVLCLVLYYNNSQKSSEASLPFLTSTLKLTQNPIFNNTSKPRAISLPDGSEVSLFPNSTLSAVSFTKAERKVRLEGKGFFTVAHDSNRPFLVYTDKLITKVLGTSFTINARKGSEPSVEVKTGKVAVYRADRNNGYRLPEVFVSVVPNHKVRLDSVSKKLIASIVKYPVLLPVIERKTGGETTIINNFNLTTNPDMNFEGTPVYEVLRALEEAYGVKIKCDKEKISACLLTANLQDEDFFTRLQTVCDLIGGRYEVKEDIIEVSSPGCHRDNR